MSDFSIIKHIDQTIVIDEARGPANASRTPAVWPSEAAARRIDNRHYKKYGACKRKTIYRMIGWPKVGSQDPERNAAGLWKFVLGRVIEDHLTMLTTIPVKRNLHEQTQPEEELKEQVPEDIYVANGVKFWVPDIYLAPEMDIITYNPEGGKAYIVECKTYDGYYKEKKIEKDNLPDEGNLIQLAIYLSQIPTGKKLKEVIQHALDERKMLDQRGKRHRNRTQANLVNLAKVDDGPIGARLVYVSRGACNRREFDISIMEGEDGFHYPVVNGTPYKIFNIESIYELFREAQDCWFTMRNEGVKMLALQGVHPPSHLKLILSRDDEAGDRYMEITKEEAEEQKKYLALLEQEVRDLPESFFPPPEYNFVYSNDRMEELGEAGLIGKVKYGQWKKGTLKEPMGDWQCGFCDYLAAGCLQVQRPDLVHLVYDLNNIPDDAEVTVG
jgi:hypothetical protein